MTDQMYLENLEEYINDENRIVTYKWLSKTLTVHVNLAKQMLYSFVQNERNEKDNDKLTVTYFVSGFMETNGEKVHKMQVIPEEKLEPTKQSLDPVTSCHVYSVQKCKIKDTNVLYMTDIDLLKEQLQNSNKYSAIKCTCAKLRSEDELKKLRTVAQPTTNAPSFTKPKSQDNTSNQPSKPQTTKKPAGIAGMFATGGKKKDEKAADSSKKNETTEKKTETASKTKAKPGIANFFGNQASKPKKPAAEEKKPEKTETKVPEKISPEPKKQEVKKQEVKKPASPKPQAKSKSRKQKVEDSDDDDSNQQKKRRRIKAAAWSDSSSDEEEAMEEEPIPPPSPPRDPTPPPKEPTPSPEKEPPTPSPEKKENVGPSPTDRPSGGKKRARKHKKKMVSKTFVDDDGFMVTEKVWEDVSESASDADDPIPPTPPVKQARTAAGDKKKKTPTKKISPGKSGTGKQTSMMSFFKKK